MHWEPNALIPLLAVILYGVLFLVVAFSRSSTQIQERRIFREYLLAMLFWSVGAFLVLIGIGGVIFEFRLMLVAALGSMVALFRFVQTVLGRRWRWAVWVYLYAAAAMTISMFTNWVVVSASVQAGVLNYEFAPQVVLVAGPGYGLYIYSLIQLMRGFGKSGDPLQRNRLRYLTVGLGLVIVSSLVNFTPLGRYPIDIAGNGINALLIAYAILRHNLLDIRVVIRKSLLYSIPTVLIGTGYFLVISLALRLFDLYSGLGIFILSLIVAILTALVAQPLRDKAQSWIDRLFFREKYHSGLMLQRLSSQAASVLDLDIITNLILEETTSILHIEKAAFLLKRGESEDFFLTTQKGMASNAMIHLSKNHPIALWFSNHDQLLTRHDMSVAPQFKALWGREREELERIEAELFIPLKVKGELVGIFAVGVKRSEEGFSQDDQLTLTTLANQAAVTIENARLYTSLSNEKQRLELLYNLSHHLTESLDSHQVATKALDHICTALGAFKGVIYVPRPDIDRWELLAAVGLKPIVIETFNQNADVPLTSGLIGWAASHKKTAVAPDVAKDKRWETIPGLDEWVRSAMATPLLAGNTIVGVLSLLSDQISAFREEDVEIVQAAAAPLAVALQNARLYAAEKRRAERLAAISKLSTEIAALHEASAVLKILVKRAAAIMESTTCSVLLIDTATNEAFLTAQTGLPEGASPELRIPLELPILRHSVESSQPIILADINHDAPAMRAVLVRPDIRAFFAYPMIHQGQVMGFITFSKLTSHTPSAEEIAACQLLAERAAVALENARLFEETARSLRQVQALHTIDMTIASSFDLHLTLNIFLEQTRTHLGVDAVDMLVYNPHTQMLDYAAGIGFRTTALQGTHMRLGQGYAGIAGLERKTIHVSNLHEHKTDFLRSPNFKAEEFDTYFGVPLIAKGQIKGVLEAFHRSPLQPNQNWMDFLETLGKQAAIAIDNATLFSDLQSSNTELILAYDTTLAGWSKALDLRDRETESHTQRVIETTMRLARAMGVAGVDLPNMRRGALLHDIGKMGVPDEILHKPAPLTAEDWAIMRQHPVYAREMLLPITYLRPAMDIPYYHHERWDGSGYPNGLKGEQIPLAARVFAVVDVFDALTSDRPYRSAWPREEALEYIREQTGKHFDPAVVEMFLRMVGS